MAAHKIKSAALSHFELDIRSLALFRIAIGSTLLIDLINDFWEAKEFYTLSGILPRTLWVRLYESGTLWSVHLLNDTLPFSRALLFVQLLLAVMLLVGYKTRLATFGSWIFFVSLLNRNLLITDGGDQIGSYLLFSLRFGGRLFSSGL